MNGPIPRITIVTISFNQSRFLEAAIKSVTEQDYPNLDYIVVDPGSTDGSRDIIARYGDRRAWHGRPRFDAGTDCRSR